MSRMLVALMIALGQATPALFQNTLPLDQMTGKQAVELLLKAKQA